MKGETSSMQVYLLRHGITEEARVGLSDADRSLTPEGRQKLREVLRLASGADVEPSLILTSPLTRAVQTAEVARDILKYKKEILRTKALLPGATTDQVWDEIRVHRDEAQLMLVGHDPLFSQLGGYLLGTPNLKIDFKKGALLRADLENYPARPHGILRWYLTAKLAAKRAHINSKPSTGTA
ncbi:MAG TPA: phosphohistidine phosphatase SixA [Bryobacteraceae bacterium]|nr:phosphohistidine phosphatase SixA [Bryobacteraceae bacterium]